MKKFVLAVVSLAIAAPTFAQSSHYVHGYTTKNGTYVSPHYQTNPDSSRLNNWSTQGNYNPYTGKAGTVNPYAPSQSSTYGPFGNTRPKTTWSGNDTNDDSEDPQ